MIAQSSTITLELTVMLGLVALWKSKPTLLKIYVYTVWFANNSHSVLLSTDFKVLA